MSKILNFTIGGIIIFSIQFFSIYILKLLNIPFPAPVLGLVILFVLLKTKIIKENWVKDFCKLLLKYMILFFIPLFVGLVSYFDLIKDNFLAIVFTIVLTTTLIIVSVGLFVENVIKFLRLRRIKNTKKAE